MTTATASTQTPAHYVDSYGVLDVVSTVDAAKELRKALKKSFPDTRFAVRARPQSRAIDINWDNGPLESDVEEVARQFTGIHGTPSACGDYMQSYNYKDNGRGAHYNVEFMFCWRDITDEMLEATRREIIVLSGKSEDEFMTLWHGESHAAWDFVHEVLREVFNLCGTSLGQLQASQVRCNGLRHLTKLVAQTRAA
ncbi:LPD29 domain-containing protein [Citricoccus nitrophenolicus]|uniref:LPD29 domain-containing protein n=1 Tax=Citricoccus nitrophenolicus TaxID=863575 RepID=UPI0031F047DA